MSTGTRGLVDPELLGILDVFPTTVLSPEILSTLRQPGRLPYPPPDEKGAAIKCSKVSTPGPKGAPEVGVLIYIPPDATEPLPCIFHIHGGGYVMGDVIGAESVHRTMVASLNCVLVTVDYRLAPETRFPGAVEDCYAALSWVFANAATLGVDATRIGVMGESAGGGLAASLALLVRDRGEHALAFQHLIYPMIDDRTCTTTRPPSSRGRVHLDAAQQRFRLGGRRFWGSSRGRTACRPMPRRRGPRT